MNRPPSMSIPLNGHLFPAGLTNTFEKRKGSSDSFEKYAPLSRRHMRVSRETKEEKMARKTRQGVQALVESKWAKNLMLR